MSEKKTDEEHINEFNRLHKAFVNGEGGFISGEDESEFDRKKERKKKSVKLKLKRICECKKKNV